MLHLNLVLASFVEKLRARARARACVCVCVVNMVQTVQNQEWRQKVHVLFESRLLYQLEYHASLRL